MLAHVSEMKSTPFGVGNEPDEFITPMHAHNGPGVHTWIILNNLTFERIIVDLIKKSKGIFSLNVSN